MSDDYGDDYDDQDVDVDYFDNMGDDDYECEEEQEEVKLDVENNTYLACENNLYQQHHANTIIETIKLTIKQIASENGISLGRAFLILRENNYDRSKCDEIPDKIMDDIFFKESNEVTSCKNTKECLLCYDDLTPSTQYSLDCKHNFCKESCFKQYLKACLKEGQQILLKTCPMVGCKERVGLQEFQEFFKDEKERVLLNKFLLNDALQHAKNLIQCPHSNCDEIFDFGQSEQIRSIQLNLKCSCEKGYFCNLCKEDAHQPCNCDMLKKWMELIQGKNSEDLNSMWLKLNTKPCPKCKIPIQKNQGCMHMNCKQCNFHFCWLCLGEYVNHNDFYSCNKYTPEEKKGISKEEETLQKYEFFTERFKDHLGAVRLAQKEASQHISNLKKSILQSNIDDDQIDACTEFYIHAYDILIEAKKCIAYTYPIGYYIERHKRDYFEFLQGQLEQNINPFEELLGLVDFNSLFYKENMNNPFYEYKSNVLDKTKKIRNYLCKMMKNLGDELPELDIKKLKSISKKISMIQNGQKKNQSAVGKPSQQAKLIEDILMCDDCKINPSQNDYGLCNNCLNTRYQ